MARMTNERLLTAARAQITAADGYNSDELSEVRDKALDYYYNRANVAPTAPGRSSVQSSDVADMVEAVTAQIMPAFEAECIVEFEPLHEQDVEQASSETEAVNYVVMDVNKGHYQLQNAIKDALLMRNGVIKVWKHEQIDIDTQTGEMLTEMEYGDLLTRSVGSLDDVDNGIQITSEEENPDMPGFWDVTIKTKNTKREIRVESIDPINFMWSEGWDSIYLQECPFVAERSMPTRSDLIQMGYPKSKVNKLPSGTSIENSDVQARNQNKTPTRYQGEEPSQDLIEFFECYMRIDMDGDGIAELMKVCIAGNEILEKTEVPFNPFASGTPFLQPHRFNGLGLFDKLQYIQDCKTATMRQLLDNQNHANNARVGVLEDMVNMDDVTNSRPGGVVRIQSPDALVPFPFTDIGPSAQATLNYLDQVRAERGGASLDLITAEAQIAGDTAHGVERQMTAKEMLAAQMTRTLADTLIRTTFELVHQAMRLYITDPISFRSGGQFVQADPTQWQERERTTVKAGLSMAERNKKKVQLENIMARQDQLLQAGMDGVMVNLEGIYNAQVDWSRASGMDSPDRYFINPSSPEAQQAGQQKQQQAQEQQAYQEQLLQLQKDIEDRKANNDDAKVIEDARQFDLDLQFKYWQQGQESELKEAELITDTAMKVVDSERNERDSTAGQQASNEAA